MNLPCVSLTDRYSAGRDCCHSLRSMRSPTCTPYRFKQHGPSHLNAEGTGNLRLALMIHSPRSLASSEAPPRSHVDFGRELALDFPLHSVSPPTPLPSQFLGSFVPSRVCLPHGTWPLMWVDMGQPLLSFCFWTGDLGCCRLQTLRVHSMDSASTPRPLAL